MGCPICFVAFSDQSGREKTSAHGGWEQVAKEVSSRAALASALASGPVSSHRPVLPIQGSQKAHKLNSCMLVSESDLIYESMVGSIFPREWNAYSPFPSHPLQVPSFPEGQLGGINGPFRNENKGRKMLVASFLQECVGIGEGGISPRVAFKITVLTMEWEPPSHSKLFTDSLFCVMFATWLSNKKHMEALLCPYNLLRKIDRKQIK